MKDSVKSRSQLTRRLRLSTRVIYNLVDHMIENTEVDDRTKELLIELVEQNAEMKRHMILLKRALRIELVEQNAEMKRHMILLKRALEEERHL